jgi:dipeptidyl aminopeptidase/acylaminoacyl peptidase
MPSCARALRSNGHAPSPLSPLLGGAGGDELRIRRAPEWLARGRDVVLGGEHRHHAALCIDRWRHTFSHMRSPLPVLLAALVVSCAAASDPEPAPQPAKERAAVVSPATPVAASQRVVPDVPPPPAAARDAELRAKVAPIVDAFLNSAAIFTRDGKRVVFVSNRDGLPQLYVADAARPNSPARRLLDWPQRMQIVQTTPDGKSLLFRSDQGADENWSIWKVDLDGSKAVELTPGEKMQRDHAHVADLAPGTIWFSGRKMSEPSSAVFAVDAATPAPAREVYRDPKPGFLTDTSRDGKRGLFIRYPSRSENYLLHLDLASGATRVLYPKAGRVSIRDARFSPDGKTVYLATDDGGDQARIVALDADGGVERARYAETQPPVGSFTEIAVAKKGNRIAATLDAGDRSEIRLLDARTLRPRPKVVMPLGQGEIQEFTEDGTRLTVVWSKPDAPTDAWVVDAIRGSVARLRDEPRPSLAAPPEIETTLTKVKAHDGLDLPLIVQLPRKRDAKLPVIVWYHGGPSSTSKVRWSPYAAFFVSQGYAWVEPNVRGSGGFGRTFEEADNGPARLEAFKDIETTGRWAASQPWADPNRVIVFGGSYGGYTVLVALTRMPDLWRAGVDLFGVANLKTFMATTSGFIREIFHLEFGHPEQDAAFLDSISPLRDADRIVDPLFVYAGANDPRVPRSESDLIVRVLRERKVPVEYMVADNEGHSLARKENLMEFLARSARFLETHAAPRSAPSSAR